MGLVSEGKVDAVVWVCRYARERGLVRMQMCVNVVYEWVILSVC